MLVLYSLISELLMTLSSTMASLATCWDFYRTSTWFVLTVEFVQNKAQSLPSMTANWARCPSGISLGPLLFWFTTFQHNKIGLNCRVCAEQSLILTINDSKPSKVSFSYQSWPPSFLIYDILAQQNRCKIFWQNVIDAGQNQHWSKSAQKKMCQLCCRY